jgi:hypothetical protein
MKKIIYAVAIVMGAGLSSVASAATTPTVFASGNYTVTTDDADCPMLTDQVVIGVSSKVHGGYSCNETSAVIKVAACHEGGSRNTGVACAWVDLNDPVTPLDATDDTLNSAGCTAQMVTDGDNSTIPNYNSFSLTSNGGSITAIELEGRCDDASLTAITFW